MARRYKYRNLLIAQMEHLQYCAFSEAVAKVLTERGDTDVHPYYNTLWHDEQSYNYYPSDVFPAWQWHKLGADGNKIHHGKIMSELTDEEIKQITGIAVTIWTRINGEERTFTYKMQYKDLQPEARNHSLFINYDQLI